MKISIVIPVFNEQENIKKIYQEILEHITPYEIIFVDDGSTDNTLEAIKKLPVKYISFSRNFGKEAALFAGLSESTGDYVAIMDADMQDPPHMLPTMMSLIQNCDCVATYRKNRKGESVIKSFFSDLFYKIINSISSTKIVKGARDYRLMTRKYVDAILSCGEYNRFSKGLFAWVGFKTEWIGYKNIPRKQGESKWSFWSLFCYAIDGIVNFSQVPLYIASFLGISMTFLSVLSMAFIILRYLLFGDKVAGWASTMTTLIFIGGVILFCMGITNQYLAKLYLEAKKRPLYIIKEKSTNNRKEDKL